MKKPDDTPHGSKKDTPVSLDDRRSTLGRVEVEVRRDLLADIRSGQAAERRRQEEFEQSLFSHPALTWAQAVAKAEYLLQLFAATPYARADDKQALIAGVLDDFAQLARVGQAPYDAETSSGGNPVSPDSAGNSP